MKTTQSYTVAGTNAHRVDGVEKVTGKAVYTGDIQLPGMARQDPPEPGSPRSPHQSRCVEGQGAARRHRHAYPRRYQGVRLQIRCNLQGSIHRRSEESEICRRSRGGGACGRSRIGEHAVDLIEVEYEELPKVTNIEEATAPGAIQVHEGGVARA